MCLYTQHNVKFSIALTVTGESSQPAMLMVATGNCFGSFAAADRDMTAACCLCSLEARGLESAAA